MILTDIHTLLGDEVANPDEGSPNQLNFTSKAQKYLDGFLLFSQPLHSPDLGMIDPKTAILDITVAGRDFCIQQSPAVLTSHRAGGTTGAGKRIRLLVTWRNIPDVVSD